MPDLSTNPIFITDLNPNKVIIQLQVYIIPSKWDANQTKSVELRELHLK